MSISLYRMNEKKSTYYGSFYSIEKSGAFLEGLFAGVLFEYQNLSMN